jgi:hypothetical protein
MNFGSFEGEEGVENFQIVGAEDTPLNLHYSAESHLRIGQMSKAYSDESLVELSHVAQPMNEMPTE